MNADVVDAESRALVIREEEQPQAQVALFDTSDPEEFMAKSAKVCKILVDVIEKQGLAKQLGSGKKKHVEVEGWQFLASMPGIRCTAVIDWTKEVGSGDGWEARALVYRDGQIVGAGEGMCLRTESKWKSKDYFTLRSMAQTRAISRALQGPLRWVMVLAGYAGAGTEEMADDAARAPYTPPSEPPPRPGPTAEEEAHRKGVEAVLDLCHKLGRATPAREDLERASVPELRTLWEGIKRAGSASQAARKPPGAPSLPSDPGKGATEAATAEFPAPGGPPMEPKTQRHLFALLGELGYTDHAAYHGWLASQGLGPHADAVASFADLSQAQAKALVRLATEERAALRFQCPACNTFDRENHAPGCPEK